MAKVTEVLTALEFDGITGKTTIRDLTADELAQRTKDKAEAVAQEAEAQAKADVRTSALNKLSALGLTQEEIDSL